MSQTIQGLNLESHITTVKIQLEGSNIGGITEILDNISSFHPIFIHGYLISPTLLTIRSKLPFLWRESEDIFKKLAKGDITLDKAKEYVIESIIQKRVKSMSTIPILESAHKKNIETTLAIVDDGIVTGYNKGFSDLFNRYYVLGCGRQSHITGSISSSKDAVIAKNIQRDKWSTNTMVQRLGLPLPKWEIVDSKSDIEKIFSKYEKPVVIKPTGLTGGKGVFLGINTLEEAKEAYDAIVKGLESKVRSPWQTKIMIQEQVSGEDYRLLVIDGKLEVVTKRIPAFVIGDGKHTVEELIKETNKDPRRNIYNPAHILKPINIDQPLKDYLKQQNFSLGYVPSKGEQVNVRKVASMSQGGVTEDFTDSVGKEIKLMVESIAQSIHAFTLGVDVMCNDISKPLTKDNGAILEINTMPEAYLNLFPTLGKQRGYVSDIFVEKLLKENSANKIVVVGQSIIDIPTLLRKSWFKKKEFNIGEVVEDRYLINGIQINEDLERWKAVEAIKCNSLLDILILHHRNWDDVKENGLGFDHINTIYITKDQSTDKKNMGIIKKYKKMKLIDNIKII
ncbi:MAG: Cyanophycin synthetase [candidate division WS6 bacterium GW2011_GWB1_33_6]|uniref:Cyanophycin synthetase n=1 Tax=candidate division WS6 bacterium GW2011_GWB1_33_6 TaxID=1619088 RepID=A0A0G0CUW4_9BACT|nr:MAG: Cyanophycin synthetase [candidate division WS6 bacterium GW2011_GWB1_33_6]